MAKLSFFGKKEPQPANLVEYTNKFANNTRRERAYKRKFWSLAKQLSEFEKLRQLSLTTDNLSIQLFDDFCHHLKQSHPYKISTLTSIKARLQTVIRAAQRDGFKCSLNFVETKFQKEDAVSVYLTNEEIERIFNLTLQPEARVVRDRFVVGCCTGLRYSDYSTLNTDNFADGLINIRTRKTGAKVVLPIHWMIAEILIRNKGILPEIRHSQQNFNKIIKTVCKRAKIDTPVMIERTEGNKVVRRKVKKYEMVASHTARRSFATNLYLEDVPAAKIMLFTGHTTEQSFFKYIRIGKQENANELSNHPFFNKQS